MKAFSILVTIFFWITTLRVIPQALDGKSNAIIMVLFLIPFSILVTLYTIGELKKK